MNREDCTHRHWSLESPRSAVNSARCSMVHTKSDRARSTIQLDQPVKSWIGLPFSDNPSVPNGHHESVKIVARSLLPQQPTFCQPHSQPQQTAVNFSGQVRVRWCFVDAVVQVFAMEPHVLTVFNFDSSERRKVWCEAIAHASSAPTSSNVRLNDLPTPSQSPTCAHCLQLWLFRTAKGLVRSHRARNLRANLEQRQAERPPKAFTKSHKCGCGCWGWGLWLLLLLWLWLWFWLFLSLLCVVLCVVCCVLCVVCCVLCVVCCVLCVVCCVLCVVCCVGDAFLRLFCWRSREYPFFRGRVECSLVFFFKLVYVFGMVRCLASGASLLSVNLFLGPVLKFRSVGTSLMRIFDLYFSQRWSFLFLDTCLTLRRLSESLSSVPRLFASGFEARARLPLWESSNS